MYALDEFSVDRFKDSTVVKGISKDLVNVIWEYDHNL